MLAMLFLVLFATLAIGFYASTDTAAQVSSNDTKVNRSLMAADSGMELLRYKMERVSIPPNTPSNDVLAELYEDLLDSLEGTANMGSQTIGASGNILRIPSATSGSITLGSNADTAFRATVTDFAGEMVIKVDGISIASGVTRSIQMDFSRKQKSSSIFGYAVASKGQINVRKGAVTSVAGVDPTTIQLFSAEESDPSIKVSGGVVGGDLNIVDDGGADVTGGTVGGSSIPSEILANHVHTVTPPEFPTIDTSPYAAYAVNSYVSGARTQQNIRIPANTNPRFNGGDTVQGIMYIESPNTVTFRGNFNLQGLLVFENTGDTSANVLDFRGNVSQQPLPAGAQFDPLRASTGVSILAPTAAVTMSGSTDSLLRGNVIIGSFSFNGSADIQIDRGTLMAYNTGTNSVYFNGKTVKFTATGATNVPTAGVSFSSYFQADPTSYLELRNQ